CRPAGCARRSSVVLSARGGAPMGGLTTFVLPDSRVTVPPTAEPRPGCQVPDAARRAAHPPESPPDTPRTDPVSAHPWPDPARSAADAGSARPTAPRSDEPAAHRGLQPTAPTAPHRAPDR